MKGPQRYGRRRVLQVVCSEASTGVCSSDLVWSLSLTTLLECRAVDETSACHVDNDETRPRVYIPTLILMPILILMPAVRIINYFYNSSLQVFLSNIIIGSEKAVFLQQLRVGGSSIYRGSLEPFIWCGTSRGMLKRLICKLYIILVNR
ncbi:hypothetical protein B0H65DRAFT_542609 [Neurospora tetraspora]|uniref:Uncharacterized protein n=1 Tax=Neurospora tetraspora TaxID=94610 RepID=A0AAE0J7A0_9PEZI|nr:hypothetical protein B0H65DRAFT_542609 [Neurospora tetraspora]